MNRQQRRAKGGSGGTTSGGKHSATLKLARDMTRRGFNAEAGNLYRQILQEDPDNFVALLDLGIAAVERLDIEGAAPYLARVAALDPRNPWGLIGLAIVRMEQGDMAAAVKLADKCHRLECPPQVLTKLGMLYKEAGQLDRARQCLRQALVKKPDFVMAWFNLQGLKKFTAGDSDIARLQDIAAKADTLPAHERIHLQFTLGKALVDSGDAEKGFAHFAEGNRLKRATFTYDVKTFEDYAGKLIAEFDEGLVRALRGKVTVKSDRPVFVVGLLRSGSTLVDQILSSHPDVASLGEAKYLQECMTAVPDVEMQPTAETLDEVARKYLAATEPFTQGKKRVVDKMLFNFMRLGVARLAFPGARVIRCLRDPADVGLSIWSTLFAANIPWAYDQAEIARYALAYEKLMQHWHRLFPGEIYDVRYETMVADQEAQTRQLLDFCGLPFDDRCLAFYKNERRVSTASDVQVRQPMYGDSVKKWKKYEKYLGTMIETLGAQK